MIVIICHALGLWNMKIYWRESDKEDFFLEMYNIEYHDTNLVKVIRSANLQNK